MKRTHSILIVSCGWLFPSRSNCFVHPRIHRRRLETTTTTTTCLDVTKKIASVSDETRSKRISKLNDWAESVGIKIGGVEISSPNPSSGLGIRTTRDVSKNDLLIEVPATLAQTVRTPTDFNLDAEKLFRDKKTYRNASWYAQLSLQFNALDRNWIPPTKEEEHNKRPWLDTLPRRFDTPIHWSDDFIRNELQYDFLTRSIATQNRSWREEYSRLAAGLGDACDLSWDEFLWGCECARSRAFSGSFTGSTFDPAPYLFTLLLVVTYVGLGLGTLEQAANGAALVFCGSVLKDFVIPKFLRKKTYVVCPVLDMANHFYKPNGNVALEYFAGGYSLTATEPISSRNEVYVSYGPRSNDQLLQYYGFVEMDNPHDVYVMPPLREWDIAELERACGKEFGPGRLEKLENAGLLGRLPEEGEEEDDDTLGAANRRGGVVVTRSGGVDPAVLQALRALVSTEREWEAAGEAVGNFATEFSTENDRMARLAARTALQMELDNKPTTLQEDEELLKVMRGSKVLVKSREEELAILFRIEKKKLLEEVMRELR